MTNKPKYPDVRISLEGEDGNAFAIMGRVARALRKAGAPDAAVHEYRKEAMSGDYDNLLRVTMRTVTCDGDDDE